MKQIVSKLAAHGKRCVHSSIFLPVIALTIFSFVDLPLFSMAQEIKMSTPIVRTYRIAQTERAITLQSATETAPMVTVPVTTVAPEPTTTVEPNQPAPIPVSPTPVGDVKSMTPSPTNSPQTDFVQPAPSATTDGGGPVPREKKEMINIEDEGTEMEFIDPREVKNALNDIKRMQSELKKFLKQVKKLPNSADDAAAINVFLTQLADYKKNISAPTEDMSLREALQDFWDARMWEEVDKIRAKVELPKELNNVAKDLKKAKKLLTQKPFTKLGFDMTAVAGSLAEVESAYNEAKSNYDQGNMEDAQAAMEVIHGGLHPGEIMGVLYQMREIKDRLKAVRNKEVKAVVDELLAEVIDSANGGDFREANQALNDIRAELMKLMQKYQKATGIFDDKTRAKLDKLEEMITNKLGGEKQEKIEKEELKEVQE